jgi:hypothetical protein
LLESHSEFGIRNSELMDGSQDNGMIDKMIHPIGIGDPESPIKH